MYFTEPSAGSQRTMRVESVPIPSALYVAAKGLEGWEGLERTRRLTSFPTSSRWNLSTKASSRIQRTGATDTNNNLKQLFPAWLVVKNNNLFSHSFGYFSFPRSRNSCSIFQIIFITNLFRYKTNVLLCRFFIITKKRCFFFQFFLTRQHLHTQRIPTKPYWRGPNYAKHISYEMRICKILTHQRSHDRGTTISR